MSSLSSSRIDWFNNVEQRPHPWPGLNWLTPMLVVPDVQKAKCFYESTFGIVSIFDLPDENGQLLFARLRYRGCNFTLTKEETFGFEKQSPCTTGANPPFVFYLYVDDVDQLYQRALDNGCQSLVPPQFQFWGDKTARIVDPFGYIWDLACKIN